MTERILTDITSSVTEFKINPMRILSDAEGDSVAILNRNKPVFYCVPADLYEEMIDTLEDIELAKIIKKRANQKEIKVRLNDL